MSNRISNRRIVHVAYCAGMWAILALTGCGSSPEATVSGTVTYKGKPLPSGTVAFIDADNKVATSSIDSQGRYSISRAPIGPVTITISTPPPLPKPKLPEGAPAMPSLETTVIPAKYSKQGESGLNFTVVPGPQEHLIELK